MKSLILADGASIDVDMDATSLSYADRCLGDDGADKLCLALASHGSLQELNLRGCHLHSAGAAAVAELLRVSSCHLRSLSLEWNSIGTSEAGVLSIAKALVGNASLTTLDLRNNRVSKGNDTLQAIASTIRANELQLRK